MKTLFRTNKYVLFVAGIVSTILILSCAEHQMGNTRKVEIAKEGILLHPAVKLSQTDEKALNNVLKKYDKTLYKIETYENGQLQKTQGKLKNAWLDKATLSEVAQKAKTEGFSDSTIQFGFIHVNTNPNPPPIKTIGITIRPEMDMKAKELTERLEPILQKYGNK